MLPAPSADALAHSQRVTAHLAALIDDAGGWMPFSRFMERRSMRQAGTAPPARKFGAAGDFVTAPMTPCSAARWRDRAGAGETGGEVELGAGGGRWRRTCWANWNRSAHCRRAIASWK
jgi:hypothetical protein